MVGSHSLTFRFWLFEAPAGVSLRGEGLLDLVKGVHLVADVLQAGGQLGNVEAHRGVAGEVESASDTTNAANGTRCRKPSGTTVNRVAPSMAPRSGCQRPR